MYNRKVLIFIIFSLWALGLGIQDLQAQTSQPARFERSVDCASNDTSVEGARRVECASLVAEVPDMDRCKRLVTCVPLIGKQTVEVFDPQAEASARVIATIPRSNFAKYVRVAHTKDYVHVLWAQWKTKKGIPPGELDSVAVLRSWRATSGNTWSNPDTLIYGKDLATPDLEIDVHGEDVHILVPIAGGGHRPEESSIRYFTLNGGRSSQEWPLHVRSSGYRQLLIAGDSIYVAFVGTVLNHIGFDAYEARERGSDRGHVFMITKHVSDTEWSSPSLFYDAGFGEAHDLQLVERKGGPQAWFAYRSSEDQWDVRVVDPTAESQSTRVLSIPSMPLFGVVFVDLNKDAVLIAERGQRSTRFHIHRGEGRLTPWNPEIEEPYVIERISSYKNSLNVIFYTILYIGDTVKSIVESKKVPSTGEE